MKTTQSKLLFICGFPGGGTDLTKTVMNVHPDIYLNGEMPFLKDLAQQGYSQATKFTNVTDINALQRLLKASDVWHNIENIDYDFRTNLEMKGELALEEILQICFSDKARLIWGNKTPQTTENMAVLLALFPSAHFLIVTRDVRDVCLSWRNKWGSDPILCAAKWTQRMKKGWTTAKTLSPDRYLFIKYEDLLAETETTCLKICQFLGLPFSERMLDHQKYTPQQIDGKINYGQGVKKDNVRKWEKQLSPKTVKRIEEVAFDTMELLGYESELASEKRPISPSELLRGRWHDIWALLLVGNRASEHNTLKHRLKSVAFEFKKLRSK